MLKTISEEDLIVSFEDNPRIRNEVFRTVLRYFIEHDAYIGEVILQDDDCIIDAPDVFAEIADKILKFEVKYKE